MADFPTEMDQSTEKSHEKLRHYLKLHKKYPKQKYFVPLAEIYRSMEHFDEAATILQDGLRWHPTYFIGRALLADTYYQMGHYIQASLEAERVIDSAPSNLLGLRVLIRSYLKLGKTEEARNIAQSLLKIIPGDADALHAKPSQPAHSPPPSDIKNFTFKKLSAPSENKKIDRLNKLLIRVQSHHDRGGKQS